MSPTLSDTKPSMSNSCSPSRAVTVTDPRTSIAVEFAAISFCVDGSKGSPLTDEDGNSVTSDPVSSRHSTRRPSKQSFRYVETGPEDVLFRAPRTRATVSELAWLLAPLAFGCSDAVILERRGSLHWREKWPAPPQL